MKESKLQKQCLEWVKNNYRGKLVAINIHGGGYANKGFPDLIVFGGNRAIVIELKSDTGYKIQPDQIVWANRFKKIGTAHYLLHTFDEFKTTIRKEFPNETS